MSWSQPSGVGRSGQRVARSQAAWAGARSAHRKVMPEMYRHGGPCSKKKVLLAPLRSLNETGEELVTDRRLAQKRGGTLCTPPRGMQEIERFFKKMIDLNASKHCSFFFS